MEDARTSAHRYRVAQDPVQPGLRLLHRGHRRRTCTTSRRTTIRKQTIAGGERFITPGAEGVRGEGRSAPTSGSSSAKWSSSRRCARASRGRRQRFRRRPARSRRSTCSRRSRRLRRSATTRSRTMHDADAMAVVDGRHPVVERHAADAFVPNDIALDGSSGQLVVVDRPEHGRQVDVPATDGAHRADGADRLASSRRARRKLGIVDRIFTRVGASDNLARGQSHLHGRDAGDGRTSCTSPRRRASSSSTRSAVARHVRRSDASRGPWPSTSPRTRRRGRRRSSRRTITS